MGELAEYEDKKQIQCPACITEIVEREDLEQQQFQGINGKVGNGKTGKKKPNPCCASILPTTEDIQQPKKYSFFS